MNFEHRPEFKKFRIALRFEDDVGMDWGKANMAARCIMAPSLLAWAQREFHDTRELLDAFV
jgi:hypothetical protein